MLVASTRTLSVISSHSDVGCRSADASAARTSSANAGWAIWRGETFTETANGAAGGAPCHRDPLLRHGDEVGRREQPAIRVLPSEEGLHRHGVAVGQSDDRLVVGLEGSGPDRLTQFALRLEAHHGARPHPVIEELVPRPAAFLRPVQGGVRVTNEVLGRILGTLGDGDADARGDDDLTGRQRDGMRDRPAEPGRDVGRFALAPHVLAKDHELVAPEPADGVTRAEARPQPLPDADQHLVPRGVPQAVVDDLEPVEVEEHHGHRMGAPLGPRHGLLQPVHEERPVRKAGEWVVERLVSQLLLRAQPRGHVLPALCHRGREHECRERHAGVEDLEVDHPQGQRF